MIILEMMVFNIELLDGQEASIAITNFYVVPTPFYNERQPQ